MIVFRNEYEITYKKPPPTPPYQFGTFPRLTKEGARGWLEIKPGSYFMTIPSNFKCDS